ncbi:hypothetical protein EYC80_010002 [Monilinia laxa]|uniref:Uncharacterized protein n=1 Tax=Monilinia laxa TaxID=61186 RepID=A0A5N6JRZ4_MONLA|nr:hypothetical protein EYC80_010002 [Monilinia laxa]
MFDGRGEAEMRVSSQYLHDRDSEDEDQDRHCTSHDDDNLICLRIVFNPLVSFSVGVWVLIRMLYYGYTTVCNQRPQTTYYFVWSNNKFWFRDNLFINLQHSGVPRFGVDIIGTGQRTLPGPSVRYYQEMADG